MASPDGRTIADVEREIAAARVDLARSIDDLRSGVEEATDVPARIGAHLPLAAAAAATTGFVLFGGIGATMRLVARRSREGTLKASFGRFSVVEHD